MFALSAGAGKIYCTASAQIGSVGCVAQILDASAFYESLGLKFTTFASGKFKAAGDSKTPLTPDAADYFQGMVMRSADSFKAFVSQYRPGIDPELMDGRVMRGSEAVAAGFADEIVPSLEAAIALVAGGAVPLQKRKASLSPGGATERGQFNFKPLPHRPGQTAIHTPASLAKTLGATAAEVSALLKSGRLPTLKTTAENFEVEISSINRLLSKN